ncbi:unnamed protein product [Closterium sp. Yama58-4]|nr:unnamed protein product [Closterium sp. Yama58-4]
MQCHITHHLHFPPLISYPIPQLSSPFHRFITTLCAPCIVFSGPYLPPYLTSYSDPVNLFQSASSNPNGSISLSSASTNASWGAAFIQRPITLFFSTTKNRRGPGVCGDVCCTAGAAAVGVGLGGLGKRSVAVEFDSVLSVKHSDPNDNHVGVNVGGSPVSLASATAPLILNDAHTKHAWIHYDPTSAGTLRVFLSASRQQPSKAVVTARVSLCTELKPTIGDSSFLFGFLAASANNTQRHDIIWWNIATGSKLGQVASKEEVTACSEIVPSSFHYASLAFIPNADGVPSWSLPSFVSWVRDESTWPVKNQHGCACTMKIILYQPPKLFGYPLSPAHHSPQLFPFPLLNTLLPHGPAADSSAYAVVAAVEAAYSIARNSYNPPQLSVD